MFSRLRLSRSTVALLSVAGLITLSPVIPGWAQSPVAGSAALAQAPEFPPGSTDAWRELLPQTGRNTSASPSVHIVSGVVVDPSGGVVAGAQVTLQARNGSSKASTTTNRRGEFRFDGVLQGDYEIEVQRDGFKTWKKAVEVGTRPPPSLRVELQLATLTQKITVPLSDRQVSTATSDNTDVIALNRELLRSLPVQGNDVIGTVTRLMGADAQGPGGAQLIVNGVAATDLGVPPSAIQEVKINKDPYSAQYSSPGQKRIHITTKTGSNQYHGSLSMQYRGYRLDARNAFASERPPEQRFHFGGGISGPISKSRKTTFMINAERYNDDLQGVVYAQTPTGTDNQNFPTPYRGTYLSGVVTQQVSETNTLSFRYSYYGTSYDGKNVEGLTLPEAAANTSSNSHYALITDHMVLGNNFVNELSLRVAASGSRTDSALPGQPSIVVLGSFTGGGAQLNTHENRRYLKLTDMISWSRGKHLVKAGINVPALTRWNLDDTSNFGGTFQFSSLQDYEQGRPFSFVQQQGNGSLAFWQKEVGLFVQDEVRLRTNLSIALGLRYDWQNYVSSLKNFAPRFSLAYAPGKSAKTVLRGGVGIFYQNTGGGAIRDMLRFNGHTLLQYVLNNPGYPDPFALGGIEQALPTSIVRFAPNLRLPYVLQYSISVERQLAPSTTLAATYIGMQGFHQFRSRDMNAPLPPDYVERPDPSIATLRQIESAGRLEGNAFKLTLNSSIGGLFNGGVQYKLASFYDNTGGIAWFPANQYNLTGEWGRSEYDARHSFSLYGTFDVRNLFLLGTILSARSGLPYTETTGTDVYGTTFTNARPPGVSRNTLPGPGSFLLDMRVTRDILLGGPKGKGGKAPRLTVSVDAFNVLNHVNFDRPVGDLTSPFFGYPVSAAHARRLQLSLGFKF